MEGSGSSKIVLTVLVVILLAGLGFGGYFLGKFLDIQAAKKQAAEVNRNVKAGEYENKSLGIKFSYPKDWSLDQKMETDSSFVSVRNSKGSEFIFSNSKTADSNIQVCDEEDPTGVADGVEACTFISDGKIKYGRYKEEAANSSEVGDTWIVLEPAEVTNPGKYVVDRAGFFYFISKSEADLEELDKIMKSVERI